MIPWSGVLVLCSMAAAPVSPEIRAAKVRAGYEVTVAVAELREARFMEIDPEGVLYVTRPRAGDIICLRDKDGDGVYETRATFVEDMRSVHGIDLHDGWVWFSTTGSILRARDTDGDGVADEREEVIGSGTLPAGGGHWWRSLLVTDDAIYTSIGDAGNITDQRETDRQKVWRFGIDGKDGEVFSTGIRNTEKLRLRPGTDEVWGFDHGSDWFGAEVGDGRRDQPITDLNPPDELNLYREGAFYGHPFVVGDRLPRYEFLERDDIHELARQTVPPEWKIGAHWATNGWCFIEGREGAGAMPSDHTGDIFVACHGSWNSSVPVGYCVARVLFDDGKPYGLLKIVDGAGDGTAQPVMRPVDCVEAPDGSILFSDDSNNRVYRIRWVGQGDAGDGGE